MIVDGPGFTRLIDLLRVSSVLERDIDVLFTFTTAASSKRFTGIVKSFHFWDEKSNGFQFSGYYSGKLVSGSYNYRLRNGDMIFD
jgi:hypothetical protein